LIVDGLRYRKCRAVLIDGRWSIDDLSLGRSGIRETVDRVFRTAVGALARDAVVLSLIGAKTKTMASLIHMSIERPRM
jgi:hypothetical protein